MKKLIFISMLFGVTFACKEVYESPVISPTRGYLVVDGVINSGNGLTDISLSRTMALDNRFVTEEAGAEVFVKADDKSMYALKEKTIGHYMAENLQLDAQKKYQLSIKTKEGKEYLSDVLLVQNNPEIDSVSWQKDTLGVSIMVHSHDDTKTTDYYQWEYVETWEQDAEYKSTIQYNVVKDARNNNRYSVVYRDLSGRGGFDTTMYYCWNSAVSANLILGSTLKLSKSEIHFPLLRIPKLSNKFRSLYSLQVKQYALSKEAFNFMETMKKNTELTGSIFDPQPAVLYGNIHQINDSEEPVLGYVSICQIREKRIFISYQDIKPWQMYANCETTTLSNNSNQVESAVLQGYLPTTPVPNTVPFPGVAQFYVAPSQCVDCRILGTNKKPDFWPKKDE